MYLTPEESLIKALQNNRDGWGEDEAKQPAPSSYICPEEDWADLDDDDEEEY